MVCNVTIQNIADAIVEWEPLGELTGFADGEDSIMIEWAEEGKNTLKVSADGQNGTLSANNRTNGMVKLKFNPGSPFIDRLRQIWQNNRTLHGPLSITNMSTGESHLMECAALEFVPPVMLGSEAPDNYEFPFLFLRSSSTPSQAAQSQIRASITI
jgi:hypothetical protein